MRIMLDTNILISVLLFPGAKMNAMMNYIFTHHQLVLSSYVVDELKSVVRRKFPSKEIAINKLLMMMRDYRTGLYCVTKCCKARNYRLF